MDIINYLDNYRFIWIRINLIIKISLMDEQYCVKEKKMNNMYFMLREKEKKKILIYIHYLWK